jgi:hypothetical protein
MEAPESLCKTHTGGEKGLEGGSLLCRRGDVHLDERSGYYVA